MSKQLDALLQPYMDLEADRDAALIAGDKDAIRVCAAWPKIQSKWKKPAGRPAVDLHRRWDWLWLGCSFDLQKLMIATRLSKTKALKALRACAAARLIYPDGTIAPAAELAIDKPRGGKRPEEK